MSTTSYDDELPPHIVEESEEIGRQRRLLHEALVDAQCASNRAEAAQNELRRLYDVDLVECGDDAHLEQHRATAQLHLAAAARIARGLR